MPLTDGCGDTGPQGGRWFVAGSWGQEAGQVGVTMNIHEHNIAEN